MNDQIKLAEARGYESVAPSDSSYEVYTWMYKGKRYFEWDLPAPFTDANDCEALIKFMHSEHGVLFTIWYPMAEDQTAVDCSRDGYVLDRTKWQGDDWKQGVCELALKVLE